MTDGNQYPENPAGVPPQPPYGAPVPGMPPMGHGAPTTAYAPWAKRVGAFLIDIAPVVGAYIVGAIISAVLPDALGMLIMLLVWLGSIGWMVYNYGMQQGETGYSLGKGVMGIKLISEQTGQPVGLGLCIARYFVHIVDALPCYVGYLWPLWDAKRQTFTDKILTQVVIEQPKP